MNHPTPIKLESIAEVHRYLGLPKPLHPLISLLDNTNQQFDTNKLPQYDVLSFYKITFITQCSGKVRYGQGYYDFDEGSMLFAAPNQLMGRDREPTDHAGYALLIHPDFLQGFPLASKIRKYGFFSYSLTEALHLSDQEKTTILSVFKHMEEELNSRIDDLSQEVIIAQIDLLLTYADRFYRRQFITRKPISHELLPKLEELLNRYFYDGTALRSGIPTVQYLAEQLHYSPTYLSDLLRSLTGQNAQQHIHGKLIEIAKEKLSASTLSISEVAYELGFEHPQSFSKLFKIKTNVSPLEFKRLFAREIPPERSAG
ncbi:AraC family transcriptional regulator [Siphonobacter sp. BAB-5385]|uniref:helix-turn-helix domain-containing protein n=1 Tax=Siphonobacter sp. BAB-5385 TaxID=1864822 RepID=UPI000B9E58DB|nr:helix-turn-helix domain-containing protein [Siphonobacter sp. BAB-5385]OZI09431.1 AraC family transcriptional regulator [Siphonobacter sp. BAB-5385]